MEKHTYQSFLNYSKNVLKQANIDSYILDSMILLTYGLNLSKEQVFKNPDFEISDDDFLALDSLVKRRAKYEPIAYITGSKEFYGLDFKVNSNTLIPRPDSEILVESVLKELELAKNNVKIIDLGTGSGCLLLSILYYCKKAQGLGIDKQKPATLIAKENSRKLSLDNRAEFRESDWQDFCAHNNEKYDIIISNPPYIENLSKDSLMQDVKLYEPHEALFAGDDGLDCYRELFPLFLKLGKSNSTFYIEIGINQEKQIEQIAIKNGFCLVGSFKDLNNIIRCLKFKIK